MSILVLADLHEGQLAGATAYVIADNNRSAAILTFLLPVKAFKPRLRQPPNSTA